MLHFMYHQGNANYNSNETPLEWSKSRTLSTENTGKELQHLELSFIVCRNAEWDGHLQHHLPKGVQNICTYKSLHLDVHAGFIHSWQNLYVTNVCNKDVLQ